LGGLFGVDGSVRGGGEKGGRNKNEQAGLSSTTSVEKFEKIQKDSKISKGGGLKGSLKEGKRRIVRDDVIM